MKLINGSVINTCSAPILLQYFFARLIDILLNSSKAGRIGAVSEDLSKLI
jgi:hypothetical protein